MINIYVLSSHSNYHYSLDNNNFFSSLFIYINVEHKEEEHLFLHFLNKLVSTYNSFTIAYYLPIIGTLEIFSFRDIIEKPVVYDI